MTFTASRHFGPDAPAREPLRKGPEVDPFAEILSARMEYAIHGWPKDRRMRRRMREVIGINETERTDGEYDVSRYRGNYDVAKR